SELRNAAEPGVAVVTGERSRTESGIIHRTHTKPSPCTARVSRPVANSRCAARAHQPGGRTKGPPTALVESWVSGTVKPRPEFGARCRLLARCLRALFFRAVLAVFASECSRR